MKQYYWIIIILFWPSVSFGQSYTVGSESSLFNSSWITDEGRLSHTVYLEYSALPIRWENSVSWGLPISSVNYEWEFFQSKNELLSLRLRSGISSLEIVNIGPSIAITGLIGRGNSHLDVSLGAFVGIWELGYGVSLVGWPIGELGYRFQKPDGGLMWKVKVGTTGIGAGVGWAF